LHDRDLYTTLRLHAGHNASIAQRHTDTVAFLIPHVSQVAALEQRLANVLAEHEAQSTKHHQEMSDLKSTLSSYMDEAAAANDARDAMENMLYSVRSELAAALDAAEVSATL
jgi:septal ring factor EnvC (AmiA/AmiB activator)